MPVSQDIHILIHIISRDEKIAVLREPERERVVRLMGLELILNRLGVDET